MNEPPARPAVLWMKVMSPADALPAARLLVLAVARQELHDVFDAESTIAALAHPEEGQLATVAQALDRIYVKVKEGRDLARRQHWAQLVDSDRSHALVPLVDFVDRWVLLCGDGMNAGVRVGDGQAVLWRVFRGTWGVAGSQRGSYQRRALD